MTAYTMTPVKAADMHAERDHSVIQLIAIDVDGTLLRSDKRLSKKVVRTIHEATAKGVRVVLASARPPRSMREIYDLLKLDTYQVNYNGALIHDPLTRRHIHHQPLQGALAARIIKVARKVEPGVVVSIEILDKWYTDHVDDTLPTETSKAFMPDYIGPLEAFLHVPVTKLMLLAMPRRIAAIREAVVKKFSKEISLAVSDLHLLQVVHPKVDKSHALAMVAKHYNVPRESVMAIGDAPNDVGMLKWAGLGVAVGNAWVETREAADIVVPANDEDGVSHAIRKYVLDK